mmetsp:Transcript_5857/g.8552  ORF Transcript_5857/g.8552 Transcript_5857/m.8552 type:complete len:108 (+) Transcript_5857:410-733(+)
MINNAWIYGEYLAETVVQIHFSENARVFRTVVAMMQSEKSWGGSSTSVEMATLLMRGFVIRMRTEKARHERFGVVRNVHVTQVGLQEYEVESVDVLRVEKLVPYNLV